MISQQRNYWVVRLGRGNEYAAVCRAKGIVAIGWTELDIDLAKYSNLDQHEFTETIAPMLEAVIPGKKEKSIAGSARQLYKFAALMKPGDVVISPVNSDGLRYFGIVRGGYQYAEPDTELPYRHRREVEWVSEIDKSRFSDAFRNSSGSIMTVFSVSPYAKEIEDLLAGTTVTARLTQEEGPVDLKEFGMESHLEDFLIENWGKLQQFKGYEIYSEDDQEVGQQYVTDIGRIDILARSTDGKRWLVIELKKGKTSDDVVGQVLRYIGWVKKNEAEPGEEVRGIVIAGQEDERLKYALSNLDFVDFMVYKVNFDLKKLEIS